jgi:hypothetical protein
MGMGRRSGWWGIAGDQSGRPLIAEAFQQMTNRAIGQPEGVGQGGDGFAE